MQITGGGGVKRLTDLRIFLCAYLKERGQEGEYRRDGKKWQGQRRKGVGICVQAMTQEKSVISLCLFIGIGGLHLDVHLMLSYSAKIPMIR